MTSPASTPEALSYRDVGATLSAESLPAGYRHTERRVELAWGRDAFGRARDAVMSWQVQRRSGIRVRVRGGEHRIRPHDVVAMRVPLWPRDVPCRVVGIVDESARVGFAYGTLPGLRGS